MALLKAKTEVVSYTIELSLLELTMIRAALVSYKNTRWNVSAETAEKVDALLLNLSEKAIVK